MTRKKMIASLSLALSAIGLVSLAAAQSGTRTYPPPQSNSQRIETRSNQGSAPRAEEPFEDRLWKYLQQVQYRNWAPLPGVTGETYEGNNPHGSKVKLFANRTAAAGNGKLPTGSILIKENFDASGSQLMAITVMYRYEGFYPEGGDWHWTKFEPNGAVSTMQGMRVTGKVGMCIECHQSAAGGDFVFANDR